MRIPRSSMHIRHQRESQDIFEEPLIHIGTTSCAVSPHHVLEVIGIDVVSYNQDTLDDHTTFLTEYEISNLGTEILRIGFEIAQFCTVNLHNGPNDLGLKWGEDLFNRKSVFLKKLAYFCSFQGANKCVLHCYWLLAGCATICWIQRIKILTHSSVARPGTQRGKMALSL